MAIECPAPGCDYEGLVDQVAGHIGGRTDEVHDGMVPTAVRDGAAEVVDDGIPTEILVLAVIALGLGVASYMIWTESGEVEDEEEVSYGA